MSDVKVTVLMPAYNAAAYIREAINSVLQQTFSDFELLIINDGSTDETEAIINSYSDPRLVLINQNNGGVSVALNTGLNYARAEYIARFDADDICYPDRLQMQYDFMFSNPEYVIIGSAADYVNKEGVLVFKYLPPGIANEEIQNVAYYKCPFVHSSVMYRKEVITKSGCYNIHAHTFEDHLLWMKVLREGKGLNFTTPLIKVRLNPGSITINEKWRGKRYIELKYQILEKNNITAEEGKELLHLINNANYKEIKLSSYYELIGKKFLWNNYNPPAARENFRKVLELQSPDLKTYCFIILSYLPESLIKSIYKLLNRRKTY